MTTGEARHVLFDLAASQPLMGGVHGAAVYAEAVLRRLASLRRNVRITAYYNRTRPLSESLSEWLREQEIDLEPISSLSEIQSLLESDRFSVLYSALPYELGRLDLERCRSVITIHGLRFVECPRDVEERRYVSGMRDRLRVAYKTLFPESYRRRQAAKFSRLFRQAHASMDVVVDSQYTKYSLLAQCPWVAESRIHVLYPPRSDGTRGNWPSPHGSPKEAHGLASAERFVLLVSANRWIKNAYRAVRAFDDLVTSAGERLGAVRCVLTGGSDRLLDRWGLRNRDRFVACGYVSRERLERLYASASAFVYPTLNEGFGYPPLEAMRFGTPVLCSGVSSVPEICGDAAIYFNPLNIHEIRARLLQILSDSSLAAEMGERGRRRYRQVARQQDEMLDVLCRIILDG